MSMRSWSAVMPQGTSVPGVEHPGDARRPRVNISLRVEDPASAAIGEGKVPIEAELVIVELKTQNQFLPNDVREAGSCGPAVLPRRRVGISRIEPAGKIDVGFREAALRIDHRPIPG